jgi:hypothetical protein
MRSNNAKFMVTFHIALNYHLRISISMVNLKTESSIGAIFHGKRISLTKECASIGNISTDEAI